jgi:hypothetical protein
MNGMPDRVLAADQPAPVTVHNQNGPSPFLIVADHAGNLLPRALGRLGVPEIGAISPGTSASARSAAWWRTHSAPPWCSRTIRAWSSTTTGHRARRRRSRKSASGEIARCLACARKGDRAFDIDPPTSSYAIMRRARPYRGENSGPGKDRCGELDTQTRN